MLPTQEAPTRSVPDRGRRWCVSHSCVRTFFCSQPGLSASQWRGGGSDPGPCTSRVGGARRGESSPAASRAGSPVQGGGQVGTEALGVQVFQGPPHRPWSGAASGGRREQRGGTCGGSWARGGAPAAAGGGGAQRGGGGMHAGGRAWGDPAWGWEPQRWGGACTLVGGRQGDGGPAWGWGPARCGGWGEGPRGVRHGAAAAQHGGRERARWGLSLRLWVLRAARSEGLTWPAGLSRRDSVGGRLAMEDRLGVTLWFRLGTPVGLKAGRESGAVGRGRVGTLLPRTPPPTSRAGPLAPQHPCPGL